MQIYKLFRDEQYLTSAHQQLSRALREIRKNANTQNHHHGRTDGSGEDGGCVSGEETAAKYAIFFHVFTKHDMNFCVQFLSSARSHSLLGGNSLP